MNSPFPSSQNVAPPSQGFDLNIAQNFQSPRLEVPKANDSPSASFTTELVAILLTLTEPSHDALALLRNSLVNMLISKHSIKTCCLGACMTPQLNTQATNHGSHSTTVTQSMTIDPSKSPICHSDSVERHRISLPPLWLASEILNSPSVKMNYDPPDLLQGIAYISNLKPKILKVLVQLVRQMR